MLDEPGKSKNSVRNFGLELCVAREDDNRLDNIRRQKIKKFSHRANMPKILDDWVLELELSVEKDLGPTGVIRVREDPAFVVLCFDHEDAKSRNEDVVNLSCAILQLKGDVIHQVVVRGTEVLPCGDRKPDFAAILKSVGPVDAVTERKTDRKC